MNVRQGEERLEHAREKLLTRPAQTEAGQSHAKLRGGQIRIEMRTNMPDENRPGTPLVNKGFELTAAHFDDRIFGGDEKTVERDERGDHGQLAQEQSG